MTRPLPLVATVLAIASLGLAGCGSSSKSKGAARAQYIAKADAICQTANTEASPLVKQLSAAAASVATGALTGGGDTARLAGKVSELHAIGASHLAQLKALTQPAGDSAAIASFMDPLTTVVNDIGQAATALTARQTAQALSLLAQVQSTAPTVTSAAKAYGLHQCSQIFAAFG